MQIQCRDEIMIEVYLVVISSPIMVIRLQWIVIAIVIVTIFKGAKQQDLGVHQTLTCSNSSSSIKNGVIFHLIIITARTTRVLQKMIL